MARWLGFLLGGTQLGGPLGWSAWPLSPLRLTIYDHQDKGWLSMRNSGDVYKVGPPLI